jgi:hypothetical protein
MWSISGVLTKLITHGVFAGLYRVPSLGECSHRRGLQAKGMNKLIVASNLEISKCCTRGRTSHLQLLNISIVCSLIILCCTLCQSQAHPCPHPRVQESEITTPFASQKLVEVLLSPAQIPSNLVTVSCMQP